MANTAVTVSIGEQEPISDSGLTIEELLSWHSTYMSESCETSVHETVDADKLNYEQTEPLVQELAGSVQVVDGLCAQCQHLMENWPDPLDEFTNFGRTLNTLKLEAAARSGCKLFKFGEAESLDMAKRWLRDCLESHTSCRSVGKHGAPTRLLWIGDENSRLVLTKEMEHSPPYVTLSYCWGLEPFAMLTSETFNAFLNAVPVPELPPTVRDAIHIARQLGLSYIWIDSLCIIQRHKMDWQREAGQMRSVYGGSQVTIAASSAKNAYEGFLKRPVHRRLYTWADILETQPDSTTLADRAWCFQERLLSARTLYCSRRGLFWECRSTIGSEFIPVEIPYMAKTDLVLPEDTRWGWHDVVRQYSKTRLTYSSDRLPALSGLATRQAEQRAKQSANQYLAGMWRKSLDEQLLWKRDEKLKERPAWQAPTWSWASIDGQVLPEPDASIFYRVKWYIRVLGVWTTLAGPDPHGAVTGGELTVGCASVHCGTLDDTSERVYVDWSGAGPVRDESIQIQVSMDCASEEAVRNPATVYLLPVAVSDARRDSYVAGLILQRCGSERGRFRRIGYFNSDHLRRYSSDPGTDESGLESEYPADDEDLRQELVLETAMEVCCERMEDMDHRERPYKIIIDMPHAVQTGKIDPALKSGPQRTHDGSPKAPPSPHRHSPHTADVVGVRRRLRVVGGVAGFVKGGLPESKGACGGLGGGGQGLADCEGADDAGASKGSELHLVGPVWQWNGSVNLTFGSRF
ncbi:uncharacterized protein PG986_010723 [Apiospora aurea]|uniref:Heterokaryon incompatibility domain-containing protein n=1 Tax=Apiospora aurea TaxID=335848 RepID=A0ABR1Q384_9PEZI